MKILVFNCGSSSLKFALFELDGVSEKAVVGGEVEEIGTPRARLSIDESGEQTRKSTDSPNHARAAKAILDEIGARLDHAPDVIGHRVVHGGAKLNEPAVLNPAVMRELEDASQFAPLHNPPALETIRTVGARFPTAPQVVVTDTGFHQTMPQAARAYAIPWELAERHGIRRYGFHGIGHGWMAQRYARLTGRDAESINVITLQLGAGCSACAIRGGRSIDTSMGLTPLEGLMMATRSGDLDPSIFPYLAEREGLQPEELEKILNHRSGLLGVSGISGDMREIVAAAESTARAKLAIEVFCYRVQKYIGAYFAAIGKTDAIIFGGGIGEHAPTIRAQICSGLEHLGVLLDSDANRDLSGAEGRFSLAQSPVALWVIPLREEIFIARAAMKLISGSRASLAE